MSFKVGKSKFQTMQLTINKANFENLLESLRIALKATQSLIDESPTAKSSMFILGLKDQLQTAVKNLEAIKDRKVGVSEH